jgi:DNA polymerase III epsilon subunit-like protein
MSNNQKICVFDLETDGKDPNTCSPVQIAAIIIDPIKLEIIEDSEFNINLKPHALEANSSYAYEDSDVLDFHAKVRGTSKDNILEEWRAYPSQDGAWKMFTSYLDMYHLKSDRKSCFTAPIAAGYNINRFDLKIIQNLSVKYKTLNKEGNSSLFYPRDVLDIMNLVFYWFEGSKDLKSYSLDNVRDYLGISKEGAHDALKDVRDTADILIRFLRLHRKLSTKVKFKNSFTTTDI